MLRDMELSLVGKRALVCGSTGGIGRAAAVELALLGAEVTLLARNGEKLAATRDALDASKGQMHDWTKADFSDVGSVHQAAMTLKSGGRVYHILVNNTGGPPGGTASMLRPTRRNVRLSGPRHWPGSRPTWRSTKPKLARRTPRTASWPPAR